jgi:tetratricopeptide (TPR) repeat protein
VFVLVSSYKIPETIQDLKKYQEAGLQYNECNYYDSLVLYDELLAKYNRSVPIALNLVDASMEQQNYYYASYIINTYLVGRELNDGDYNAVTKHIDLLDKYYGVVAKIDEISAEADQKKMADMERIQYLSQQVNQLDEQEFDKSMKLFYSAMMESDNEKGLLILKQAYDLEPRYTFLLSYIGNMQRFLNRKEDALKTYQAALELNKTDYNAIRGLAILDLLAGNKEKGLEQAQKSYEIAPYELYIPETLIIALYENGRPEEAQAIMEEAKQNEYVFDGELDAYINGNMTLEQYYISQGGE